MQQILQSLKDGSIERAEVPCPGAGRNQLVIRSRCTLISAGTERMLVDFGKANWIDKARQQPDKVRMTLDKMRTDGLMPTVAAVRAKLDQPIPLGYCNAGVVVEAATHNPGFAAGERVVSNGPHAEIAAVPQNLCARIPDSVSDEAAAFTVVGAIGLQGIRLAEPTLGETVVVTGVGLIGLITVQLLRAQGCRVLAIDFDPEKLRLAERFGAETVNLAAGEDPITAAERFSRGRGVDAVLITAATRSNEPVHQAALMCRKRGRIVLVGVAGLELSRDDFYKKELSFQVSCSYGPGRYDPQYEAQGQDYPLPYVRWTAQRNFEAVLDMMADGRLETESLISHRFPFQEADRAYDLIQSKEPQLGIVLQYPVEAERPTTTLLNRTIRLGSDKGSAAFAVIGAGGYATKILIPAFKAAGASLGVAVSNAGVTAAHAGRKFEFAEISTDAQRALRSPEFDSVIIATRHDTHARFVCEALRANKNVFVEKPLAMTDSEVDEIEAAYREVAESRGAAPRLMVGFNRRFAPHVVRMKQLLDPIKAAKAFVMTVNAGAIPADHWTQDARVGGGRIVGEGCHFVDLLRFLAGSPALDAHAVYMSDGHSQSKRDVVSFTISFAAGSIGTVHYLANGHKSAPKERLEVFCDGRILQLDNFRKLRGFGWRGFSKMNLWSQDKGAVNMARSFVTSVRSGTPSPIPFDEILEVSRLTLKIAAL